MMSICENNETHKDYCDHCFTCHNCLELLLNEREKEIKQQQARIAELKQQIEAADSHHRIIKIGNKEQISQQAERIASLIMFADTIIAASFDGCGMDGGDIQDAALNSGLLRRVTATQPCGDHCACAEYSFPSVCCRKTYTTPPQENQL